MRVDRFRIAKGFTPKRDLADASILEWVLDGAYFRISHDQMSCVLVASVRRSKLLIAAMRLKWFDNVRCLRVAFIRVYRLCDVSERRINKFITVEARALNPVARLNRVYTEPNKIFISKIKDPFAECKNDGMVELRISCANPKKERKREKSAERERAKGNSRVTIVAGAFSPTRHRLWSLWGSIFYE